jgi:hypothetical protein
MLLTLLLAAQTTVTAPGMTGPRSRAPAQPADLFAVATGEYDRMHVRTRGILAPFEAPYYVLESGSARVLVIPLSGTGNTLAELVGHSVDVTGVVRRLQLSQGTCLDGKPQSYCDDPDLPVTPDRAGRPSWPTVSITAFSAFDTDPHERRASEARTGIGALLGGEGDPEQKLTVRGRFCGVTLCGLPPATPPDRGAWRIAEGTDFVWILDREPRGKGWRLDPGYAGDAARWVEVTGRVVPCAAGRCLRASKVELAPAPRPPAER